MNRFSLLIYSIILLLISVANFSISAENQLIGARYPAVSPDGKQIAFSYMGDLWLVPMEGGRAIRLTDHVAYEREPVWSPDGKWIAFILKAVDDQGIFITNEDLSERYLVYKPGIGQTLQTFPLSWSPDSKWITFALGDGSIWIVDITGGGLRQILGPGTNESPAWSQH